MADGRDRERAMSAAGLLGPDGDGDIDGDGHQGEGDGVGRAADPHGQGDKSDEGTSSIMSASFNMVNSIVGAGMIGIPFALREAGLVVGILLLVVMGFVTDYSIMLIIKSGIAIDKHNYGDTVSTLLGRWGYMFLIMAQFLFPVCGMVAYSIIIGQVYPLVFDRVLGESFLSDRAPVIVLMTCTVMVPLSLNKRLESLARFSLLAVFGVVAVGLVLITRGSAATPPWNKGDVFTIGGDRFIQAISVMAFAYVCHHNTFMVYHSLHEKSVEKFAKVTHISLTSALLLMGIVGVSGYLPFGQATCANVLDNFDESDDFINVARFFFGITIMLTYPIECFVAREVVTEVFACFAGADLTEMQHNGITLALCSVVLVIALSTEALDLVFEINGAVNASMLAFVLPGLCGVYAGDLPWYSRPKWPAVVLSAFGVIVVVVGLSLPLAQIASGEGGHACPLPPPGNLTTPG